MAENKDIPEKAVPKKAAVKKVADEKTVDKKVVAKKPAVKKEAAPKVVAMKDEPKKPMSIQLIFQAPDLPTPKVNPRSGKLAEEENVEAPTRSAPTRSAPSRTRQRNKPEGEAKQNTAQNATQNTTDEPVEEKIRGRRGLPQSASAVRIRGIPGAAGLQLPSLSF